MCLDLGLAQTEDCLCQTGPQSAEHVLQFFSLFREAVVPWSDTPARTAVGRHGGRIFFSRVNFLCWLLFSYLFHSPVLPQQHIKDPGHSAKSAGGRLQLDIHAPYVCGFAWSGTVHGCMVYTQRADTAAVSCGTSHVSDVSTPLRWIFKNGLQWVFFKATH